MDRYVGLDVHAQSCTLGVMVEEGRVSIEALLLVTKPEVVEKVCRGWARALEKPRTVEAVHRVTGSAQRRTMWTPEGYTVPAHCKTSEQVLSLLTKAKPISVEFTMVGKQRSVLDDLRPAYLVEEDGLPYVVGVLSPAQVDVLSQCGCAELLGKLADSRAREAQGLKAYLYVFSN